MKSTRYRPLLLRRALQRSRAGASDSKTIIIIILAVVGGMLLLVCLGLAALVLPGIQAARQAARRAQSRNNLHLIGLALHNYHDGFKTFPPGGVYAPDGTPHHSWQTMLLPYMEHASLFNEIDFDVPWTDPGNEAYFRTVIVPYLNPSESTQTTPEGFAVSHYAGNQHVFFENSRWRIRDTTDGTSNTVLAGEVAAGFKAWGDPTNVRDPADGIRHDATTFGRTGEQGCQFLLMDGSVRFVSESVSPAVLKAIATPDGGESVGEF